MAHNGGVHIGGGVNVGEGMVTSVSLGRMAFVGLEIMVMVGVLLISKTCQFSNSRINTVLSEINSRINTLRFITILYLVGNPINSLAKGTGFGYACRGSG